MAKSSWDSALENAVIAFRKIKSAPKKLGIAAFCDIMFFFVYGFVTAPLFNKIVDYVIIIGSIISENVGIITSGTNPSLTSILMENTEIRALFNNLIWIYILLAIVIYMVYTFFQGIAWKMSRDIAEKKDGMYRFMKEFAILNIFWLVLFSIYHLLSLLSDIRMSALKTLQSQTTSAFSVFVTILLIAIVYFAFISYTLIEKKTKENKIKAGFSMGIKKIRQIFPAFAVIAVVFLLLNFILKAASAVSFNIMIIVGVMTVIPAMTWARVYLTIAAGKEK